MTHTYEIRHHASGEFWIYTLQEVYDKMEWTRSIGPFQNLLAAEGGIARLVEQPVWHYDKNGNPAE